MNVWECYLRWRHSKGFGVHSPYAYRLVKDVVRPGSYGYYAYHSLKRGRTGNPDLSLDRKEREFLLRLVIFLNTRRLISVSFNPALEEVAKALNIQYVNMSFQRGNTLIYQDSILEGKDDLFVLSREGVETRILEKAMANKVRILAYNPSDKLRSFLGRPLEKGLAIDWKKKFLVVPREEMEYVSYAL